MNLNKVQLIGHLGKNPEVTEIGDRKVANFTIATSESYKNKAGEKVNKTEWHNIVAWKSVDFIDKYIDKGKLVYVEGKLQTRKWDDKDGNTRYTTEILLDDIKILEKKNEVPFD